MDEVKRDFVRVFLLSSYSSDHIETRFRAETVFKIFTSESFKFEMGQIICVKIDLESMTGND